ncbi:uncharacterized protein RCC_00869 [Ramularia collo-cygni]|uniref:Autophagy-related protein 29 n=1 Tax=Ramularia collo-cygni TaxID=112498 RepID=A0A2D3UM78_9PEZI|nr:uncharacterized protein RCC_00869 [Ramularia collo-cygni]CZT14941.1 uncharacterized protein RCC_00869 [Ramularia collo-cygni]
MSPSSSTLPNPGKSLPSRQNSIKKHAAEDSLSAPANKPVPTPRTHSPVTESHNPAYTVFIRLPFNRNGFEDPPPVHWDASKDRQLWRLISKSNSGNLDWEALSVQLEVELSFLLMQAAWLYERHTERMRKLVVKIGGEGSGSGSGVGGADSKLPAQDIGSGTAETIRGGTAVTPTAGLSRTASAATVTMSKDGTTNVQHRPFRAGSTSGGRRPATIARGPRDEYYEDAIEHEGVEDASDSEDGLPTFGRSQAARRVKKTAIKRSVHLSSDGDDDEYSSGGGYLPFATASAIKADPKRSADQAVTMTRRNPLAQPQQKETPRKESSTSSAERQDLSSSGIGTAAAISPRHRAQLVGLSPRGSEGSPSMGSSFSDLDDASVTQSALEDALLSNMRQQGGGGSSMASRIGSIRDVLGRRGL